MKLYTLLVYKGSKCYYIAKRNELIWVLNHTGVLNFFVLEKYLEILIFYFYCVILKIARNIIVFFFYKKKKI